MMARSTLRRCRKGRWFLKWTRISSNAQGCIGVDSLYVTRTPFEVAWPTRGLENDTMSPEAASSTASCDCTTYGDGACAVPVNSTYCVSICWIVAGCGVCWSTDAIVANKEDVLHGHSCCVYLHQFAAEVHGQMEMEWGRIVSGSSGTVRRVCGAWLCALHCGAG